MKNQEDQPSGNGQTEGSGKLPYPDSDQQPRKDGKREKPLAIRGTLDDVLRAAMNVKPKDQQARAGQ